MNTIYIPGDNIAFIQYIKDLGNKAELTGIDGHMRWIVTQEDGTKVIARPMECDPTVKDSTGA